MCKKENCEHNANDCPREWIKEEKVAAVACWCPGGTFIKEGRAEGDNEHRSVRQLETKTESVASMPE